MALVNLMNPEIIRQLLKSEEDILSPAIKAEEALYRNTRCPMCRQDGCEKRIRAPKIMLNENGEPVVTTSPFGMGPLPDGYAHCIHCGTDFNPYTGMIFKTEASMIHGSV
jgi:hypothetical protein